MLPIRFGMSQQSSSNSAREKPSSRRSSSPSAEPPAYSLTEDTISLNRNPQTEPEPQRNQAQKEYQAWLKRQRAEFERQTPADQRTEESFTAFLEARNQPAETNPEASETQNLMVLLRDAGADMETRQSPTGETQWMMAATEENIALVQRLLADRLGPPPQH